MKYLKTFESMEDDTAIIYNTIDTAIEETPTLDYDDVFDWMNVVFSSVEAQLEEVLEEDILDSIRDDYSEYVMSYWKD